MSLNLKKLIRLTTYGLIIITGIIIASIPFLKKNKEFTTNYSPEVREVSADTPFMFGDSDSDDDDDGSL